MKLPESDEDIGREHQGQKRRNGKHELRCIFIIGLVAPGVYYVRFGNRTVAHVIPYQWELALID